MQTVVAFPGVKYSYHLFRFAFLAVYFGLIRGTYTMSLFQIKHFPLSDPDIICTVLCENDERIKDHAFL